MKDAIDAYYMLRIQTVVDELKAQYPELTYPLNGLKFEKRKEADLLGRTPFSTDGRTIFYYEKYIEKNLNKTLKYDLMHIVLHGLLGHFQQQQEYENKQYRDICMDVQVTYLLEQLGMSCGIKYGRYQWERKKQNNPVFSMSQYYSALKNEEVADELWWCKEYVHTDDHTKWAPVKQGSKTGTQPGTTGEKTEKDWDNFWKQARTYAGISDGKDSEQEIEAQFRHIGQKNAKECQYGNRTGDAAGRFKVGKEAEKNYLELLRELSAVKEVCREQPDSIDPMLYQYGFELNAGSPLIEPAEYNEQTTMNLVVIAVDVSGSCTDDETMMKFWGETYRCVSQWSRSGDEGRFLLLQCDAAIQKEEWVEAKDFMEVPEEVFVSGFGGTDFVPVFERLEQLTEEGCKIDALLYLTDGEGRYPEEQPEYPVYFVMPKEDYDRSKREPYVPDWIQTVRLER